MKNGFTLIELLATITILGLIALIITPQVFKTVNKFNDKAYCKQINMIELAARECSIDNKDTNECNTIGKLKSSGYLDQKFNNPTKNSSLDFKDTDEVAIDKKTFEAKYTIPSEMESVCDKYWTE